MATTRRRPGLARWAIIGLGGFVFVLFAAVLWYAYVEVMGLGAGGPPPLIRAEAGPIKRAPDDPGGMPVANQDSPAVRVLEPAREPVRVERILPREEIPPLPLDAPEAEEPVVIAVAPEPAPVPAEPPPAVEPTPPETAATPPPLVAPEPPPLAAPTPPSAPPAQPTPPSAPPAQPAPQARVEPQRPPPPPARPPPAPRQAALPERSAPVAGPTYRVQLGAFRSDGAADAAWVQFRQRYGGTLNGLRPSIVEAQTASGTFYRLQAGPLPAREDAVRACDAVKRVGGDCFIVGPFP